jgi:hypothetical protein
MDKNTAIGDIIRNWNDGDLLVAWNEYCDNKGYSDNIIYSMDSFNECFDSMAPLDIIDMVRGCDFSSSDDYFSYTSYGNIISFDYVEDYSEFDYDYLAEFLGENGDSNTAEVDRDELKTAFIEELINTYDSLEGLSENEVTEKFTKFIEENCYDLLTDDWDLMAEEFIDTL